MQRLRISLTSQLAVLMIIGFALPLGAAYGAVRHLPQQSAPQCQTILAQKFFARAMKSYILSKRLACAARAAIGHDKRSGHCTCASKG